MSDSSPSTVAAPGARAGKQSGYLHEIDMLRALTALAVVAVHVVGVTVLFTHTSVGWDLQNAAATALHFTREVFLSITALVMIYGYSRKPFRFRTFWRKRGLGVLLPYVVWSLFYAWFNLPHVSWSTWTSTALKEILRGDASYQLYYILLTLEFYLALPALLWFFRTYGHRPWRILAASFALQLAFLYVDFNYISWGPWSGTSLAHLITNYQWRVLPFYQFYVVLGGLAALYLDQLRAFVRRHSRLVIAGGAGALAILWLRFYVAVQLQHQGPNAATAVFQPSMVFFSIGITLFLYWLTYAWTTRARQRAAGGRPSRFWPLLSDASFGIYLVHVFILTQVLRRLAPQFPAALPAAVSLALVWLIVAAGAVGLVTLLLYTPGLSRLVGRPCQLDLALATERVRQRFAAVTRRPVFLRPARLAEPPAGEPLAD